MVNDSGFKAGDTFDFLPPTERIHLEMIFRRVFVVLAFVVVSVFAQDERPVLYPFDVTVGGQKAEMGDWGDLFAVVKEPVKADALLEIPKIAPMLIINAFPCKEDGTILMDGAPAAILFVKDTNQVKLDATMDGKKLTAGTYLMNVVANNKTSRVVFTVADGTKVKLPSLDKIVSFLKGK